MTQGKHIAIIGAGPGGYVAAIRAAQLGARVTMIENQALGGVCLNWGCIPSKALLAVVELGEKLKKADTLGLRLQGPVSYDVAQMVKRKNTVVETLVKGIATLCKTWGITHIRGTGELVDERTVRVVKPDDTDTLVQADALIVATGSSWPNLPLFPIDGQTMITSKEALDLAEIPTRLLIGGGGIEGCEFASLYSGLGSQVTVVEMMSAILPLEDEEVSALMDRELKKRQVKIYTNTTVEKVERHSGVIHTGLSTGEDIVADKVLVSVGRRFNTTGIGLEKVGVRLGSRGEIEVNERLATNIPGIYAIGDVVGKAMLAHVASAQGKVAVDNIMGHERDMAYDVVPAGIFTLPEIGRVGLTEQQVREQGRSIKVGRFRYAGLGKAHAAAETTGMCKIIADAQTDELLGVHMMGSHAADLIHEAALAMQLKAPSRVVADMIHAHPTLSEGMMEAAEDLQGLAIHQARKRT